MNEYKEKVFARECKRHLCIALLTITTRSITAGFLLRTPLCYSPQDPRRQGGSGKGRRGIFSKVRRTTSIRALLPWLLWKAKSGVQKGQAREAQSRRERVKGQGCGKVKWFPPSNLTGTVNHFRKPTGLQCKTSILKLKKKKSRENKRK